MEEKKNLVQPTAQIIKADFRIADTDGFPVEPSVGLKELREALSQRIAHMLDHDFEFLMQVLYRIDVGEQKVKYVLQGDSHHPADDLADLVIEREMKKVETRLRYRQASSSKEEE